MLGILLFLGLTMFVKSILEYILMVVICYMLVVELEFSGKFGLTDRGEFVYKKKKLYLLWIKNCVRI